MTELTQKVTRSLDITDNRLISTQCISKVYTRTITDLRTQRTLSGTYCSYVLQMESQPDQPVYRHFISDKQLADFLSNSDYTGGNNEDLLEAYILGV